MLKALIVYGGWDGHHPKEISELFREILVEEGFEVEMSQTLDSFNDEQVLKRLDLIVPIWTMEITNEQCKAVCNAVCQSRNCR